MPIYGLGLNTDPTTCGRSGPPMELEKQPGQSATDDRWPVVGGEQGLWLWRCRRQIKAAERPRGEPR